MNTATEFWSHVDSSAGPSACWPWTAARLHHRGGYGELRWQGRTVRAHRIAYELAVGPIPEGMTIDHVAERGCTLTHCCNPAHLEPVTRSENARRQNAPFVARRMCGRGHPKTTEHGRTRIYRGLTVWRCVSCERITNAARAAKRKVAA